MSYRELTPHPALRPFVDRLWIRDASAAARWLRILPDGCIDLLLDPARPQAGFVVGAMTRAVLVPVGGPSATVAVRFRPGGATPFLRTCADQLTDARIDLGQLQLRWRPPPELEGCRDLRQAADLLQQALLDRLASVPSSDPRLGFAVKSLFQPAPPAIAELAADIGWTRQHTARLFRRQVGIGPKLLARVARLHRAVVEVQARPGPSLAQAALTAGYFDQAHMDRDFRELVGRSPAQVREAGRTDPGSIRPIRSLLGEAEPAHDQGEDRHDKQGEEADAQPDR